MFMEGNKEHDLLQMGPCHLVINVMERKREKVRKKEYLIISASM